MASVPTGRADVKQCAIPEFNTTAVHPEIAVPLELKLTVPVGPEGVTVAVIVTG
jgi:hypothetical protein